MNRAADGQHRHNPSYVGQRMDDDDVQIIDEPPRYKVSSAIDSSKEFRTYCVGLLVKNGS